MPHFTRRQLAKSLTAGAATAALPWAISESSHAQSTAPAPLTWTSILPGIWRATLGQPETITPVKSRLIAPAATALRSLPQVNAAPIAASGILTPRGCLLTLPLQAQELVYGFGLQLLSIESRGKKRTLRVNADPKFDTGDSHAPVPFYVTTQGYGVLIDTARIAEVYVGNAKPRPTKALPLTPGAVGDPDSNDRHTSDSEPGQITVDVPHARGVDIYLFAGPTLLHAVQRYNLFSGGGVLPPAWGLGFWYRGDGHSDQSAIVALAKEFRTRNIPCDVLGLEPGWQSHAYSCSFAWDKARFPQPEALLHDLAALNIKANLWEHAFTHPSSPIFTTLEPYSGNYAVWGGLVPDFAAPEARRVFGEYHGKHLIDLGVSGFKLDECDGSDYTGGWSFPNASTFPSGIDGEQMHALFGLRYQHTLLEQFQKRNLPTYSLVRSSGALAAPYPFVLYSDLYDHRQFVRGIVTAGFCGLLWCPEVRDAVDPEDLIRRLQTVVFSPLAMINGWYIKNPPWKQIDRERNNADDLTPGWEELEARCREIIGWRMSLVPYLQAAFERYAADGTPPFRALAMDYPDHALARIDDQFLVGDRLMVAPLFHGEPTRTITLPPGQWHDFWTGKPITGQTIEVQRSERNIPVFIKAGSIIPMGEITASTADPASKRLTIHVYGDGSLPWSGAGLNLTWNPSTQKGHATGSSSHTITAWKPALT
jgi:alpha-D-xyloside xylohydrolase